MKALWQVVAIKSRKSKDFTATEGYIAHQCYQVASSAEEAIDIVRSYYMAGKKYDDIRAEYVRDA